MTNNGYQNQEVDIRELVYGILSSWRPVLAVGVCAGLALGGYQAVSSRRQQTDPAYVRQMQEEYEDNRSLYENTTAGYEREIENIVNSVESQQEYLTESILMQVSPYDKGIATAELFVKTDYEIMPELTFQNTDYTNALVKAYASGVKENAVLEKIAGKRKLDIRYLQELVTAVPDYENHTVTVTAAGLTEQDADALLSELLAALKSKAETFNTTVGHNEVVVLSHSTDSVVDMELAKQQTQVSDSLQTLQESLKTKRRELEALSPPLKPEISRIALLKRGARYGVIGGMLGVVLAAFFAGVSLLFSDRVRPGKLERQFELPVFGYVKGGRKRLLGSMDHLLARWFGQDYFQPLEQAAAMMSIKLTTYYDSSWVVDPRQEEKPPVSILLMGASSFEEKEHLAAYMQKELDREMAERKEERRRSFQLTACASPAADPDALRQITPNAGILLVVEKERTTMGEINRELDAVWARHGNVLGFVLTDRFA